MGDRHSNNLVQINVRLNRKTADKLKKLASDLGITQAALVEHYITLADYFKLKPIFAFKKKP
jgi:hypothetical protein